MSNEENRPGYKAICCECGHVFHACKSIAQDMGVSDAGCGSCPECKTFLNLTFDEENKEMKTMEWQKYLSSRP